MLGKVQIIFVICLAGPRGGLILYFLIFAIFEKLQILSPVGVGVREGRMEVLSTGLVYIHLKFWQNVRQFSQIFENYSTLLILQFESPLSDHLSPQFSWLF